MKSVALVGAESTGKTELSEALAKKLNGRWVPEFAREYLNELGRPYQKNDLVEIARGQLEQQKKALHSSEELVVFDTDLLVLKVWSEFKYGHVDAFILDAWESQRADFYILPFYDVPYEEDPLRENPNERPALFSIYQNELTKAGLDYLIVRGSREERLSQACAALNKKG